MEIDSRIETKVLIEEEFNKIVPYLKHIDISNIVLFYDRDRDYDRKEIGYRLGFSDDDKTIVMSKYGSIFRVSDHKVEELPNSPILKVLQTLSPILERNRSRNTLDLAML